MIFGKFAAADLWAPLFLLLLVAAWVLARRSRPDLFGMTLAGLAVFLAAFVPALVRRSEDLPFQAFAQALALMLALSLAGGTIFLFRARAQSLPEASAPPRLLAFLPALALFPPAYAAVGTTTFASASRYHEDVSFYLQLYHRILHVGDYFSTVWGSSYFSHHLNPAQYLFAGVYDLGGLPGFFLARGMVLTLGLVYLFRIATGAAPLNVWVPVLAVPIYFQTVTNQAYDELLFYGLVPVALFYYLQGRALPLLGSLLACALIKETAILLFLGLALDCLVRRRDRALTAVVLLSGLAYLLGYAAFLVFSGITPQILRFYRFTPLPDALGVASLLGEKLVLGALALASIPLGSGLWLVAVPSFLYLMIPIPGFSHPMSHHCTILWAVLLSTLASTSSLPSRLGDLRVALAIPAGYLILALSAAPVPFPAPSRRSDLHQALLLVPSSATVVTTSRLSPFFADRDSLLILQNRGVWARAPRDRSSDAFLVYDTAEPPRELREKLSPDLVKVSLMGPDRDTGSITIERVPIDVFWRKADPGPLRWSW